MSKRVRITDVSPRDGLQNEPGAIVTREKLALIEALLACGLDEIEITSFVSPKWIPQLGDAEEVCAGVRVMIRSRRSPLPGHSAEGQELASPVLSALVPNEKGFSRLIAQRERGLPLKMALFTAASETFSRRNTNSSIDESIDRFGPLVGQARELGIPTRGYVSCAIACPFEGPVEPARVGEVAGALAGIGIEEIDLGDTIGAGTANTTRAMLESVLGRLEQDGFDGALTLHLHDTFGRADECIRAALGMGIRSFDGSAAGLGGCPYASTPERRAPGNVSTALLVRTVEQAGFETGVDAAQLSDAADVALRIVGEARAAEGAS